MTNDLLQAWDAHDGLPPNRSISRWCRRLDDLGSALLPITVGDAMCLASLATSAAEWRVLHYVIRQAFTQDMLDLEGRHEPEAVPRELREAMELAGVQEWRLHAIKDRQAVRQSYQALSDVEDRRSSLEGAVVKSSGQLIRRFRSAVDAGHDEVASQRLRELSGMHTVDRHNVAFLALWREARLRPASAHASEAMAEATGQHERMPLDLREMVGRTVLEHAVEPWVEEHDAKRVGEIVGGAEDLVPGALLEQCCTLTTPVGAAFRILSAVAKQGSPVSEADWANIAGAFAWLAPTREIVGVSANAEPSKQRAAETAGTGDASDISTVAPTPDQQIRECASRVGDLGDKDLDLLLWYRRQGFEDADDVLRQWWATLNSDAKLEKRKVAPIFEELAKEHESGADQPGSWLALLSKESDVEGFSFGDLPLVADENDADAWDALVEKLEGLDSDRFLDYLPSLTRSWDASKEHADVAKALIDKVYLSLVLDENTLAQRADMLHHFLGVALQRGFPASAYGDVLKQLGEIVQDIYSARLLEQLIDTQEMLVDAECPERGALEDLLRSFQAAAQRHCTRMDRAALDVLCELLDYRDLSSESEALRQALPPEDQISGEQVVDVCPVRDQNVLIYTLDTPSGERAKKIIETRYGANVRTDNSKQASQALKGSLAWADIVICVTRAAQHAATGEIDRVTSEERLLRPDGKGSSSILRKLGEWRDGRSQGAA